MRSWRYAICAISAIAPSTTECQSENLVSAIELRRTFDHRPFGQHSRIADDPWATRPHPLDNNAGNTTLIPSSFDSRDRYDEDDYAFPRTGEVLLVVHRQTACHLDCRFFWWISGSVRLGQQLVVYAATFAKSSPLRGAFWRKRKYIREPRSTVFRNAV